MSAGDNIHFSDFTAGKIVARGRRTSATGNITTTETGVLRVDNVPMTAGLGYWIGFSGINLDTSVANDIGSARVRVSTSGTATTSSTQIAQMRNTIDDATNSNVIPLNAFYYPSASGNVSILLSCIRAAGTGNIVVFCSTVEILDMTVVCIGTDPGDSGVVL